MDSDRWIPRAHQPLSLTYLCAPSAERLGWGREVELKDIWKQMPTSDPQVYTGAASHTPNKQQKVLQNPTYTETKILMKMNKTLVKYDAHTGNYT